jgi:hypothetical protein
MPATYDMVVEQMENLLMETVVRTKPTHFCWLLSFIEHFLNRPVRRKLLLNVMVLEKNHDGIYLARKLTQATAARELQKR